MYREEREREREVKSGVGVRQNEERKFGFFNWMKRENVNKILCFIFNNTLKLIGSIPVYYIWVEKNLDLALSVHIQVSKKKLIILHSKKLFYLFYQLIYKYIQHPISYFYIQQNKIIEKREREGRESEWESQRGERRKVRIKMTIN